MSEMKLYTAAGRFVHKRDSEGQTYPVIILGNREYLVDPQEFMIWINSNWRICRWEEIGKFYAASAAEAGYHNARSWQDCTNRLLVRGLLVCGSGETKYDALYDLLSSMYLIPARGRIVLRLYVVIKLALQGRASLGGAKRLFSTFSHTESEKQILKLAKQAMISTAEVICCMEKGIKNIRNEYGLMDAVYTDSETTSDNICQTVKGYRCCQDALEAIANLYVSQQLIFDRA